ncbi:hypothetical protein NVP1016O_28 [Vibrio phage 1.016.O._10N.286.46.A11]|nr:hypothetical protein NVP1016O_28 [Vibrio phage 1.016.O._10N.286.46.A11]
MLTWKQFKEHMESSGVNNDTEVDWIDIHMPSSESDVDIHVNEDNEVTVSN